MLRHLGQHEAGVLIYTRNLLREILARNATSFKGFLDSLGDRQAGLT